MRTTLTLEDRIARDLKQLAHRSGKAFKVVVNETLRAGLAAKKGAGSQKRYRLRAASLGGVLPGIDLDKALAIADTLEDHEIARKLEAKWRDDPTLLRSNDRTSGHIHPRSLSSE